MHPLRDAGGPRDGDRGVVAIGSHGGPEVRVVRFRNVPAYRHAANIVVDLPELPRHGDAVQRGGIRVDLAYGGAYYGIVDAQRAGAAGRAGPDRRSSPARAPRSPRRSGATTRRPTPLEPDLGFVYGTIIVDTDPSTSPDGRARGATMRNVTIFADAEVDRSPCGSGTSALLAHLYAQGRLAIGQSIVNAGITGEAFEARVEAETTVGDHPGGHDQRGRHRVRDRLRQLRRGRPRSAGRRLPAALRWPP